MCTTPHNKKEASSLWLRRVDRSFGVDLELTLWHRTKLILVHAIKNIHPLNRGVLVGFELRPFAELKQREFWFFDLS